MDRSGRSTELPYRARARLADNLFLQRERAGLSQESLGRRAMVCPSRIGAIENGKVAAMLDTYVRLAGSLGVTLDDLLVGVTWVPTSSSWSTNPGYEVGIETEVPRAPA